MNVYNEDKMKIENPVLSSFLSFTILSLLNGEGVDLKGQ